MHYVYLLRSRKNLKFYLGCTGDLRKRLKEHNDEKVESTRNLTPWELKYYEAYQSKEDAFDREKRLKHHAKGYQELKKRIARSIE